MNSLWNYNNCFLFNLASKSLLKHSFTNQNSTFLLNCVIFLVSSRYWFNLRKPCWQDSVFTPLISSNVARWGWCRHCGLSGGIHTSSVCLETWKMSTKNCTFSINSFAPALPFLAWFFKKGTKPHALSYPKYFSLLKSFTSLQNVLRRKRNICVYDSLVNISTRVHESKYSCRCLVEKGNVFFLLDFEYHTDFSTLAMN